MLCFNSVWNGSWKDSKFRETGGLKHIYKNESNKSNNPIFAHDAAYSDCKDLAMKTTISGEILEDRAYEDAIIIHMMDIKED